MLGFGRKEGWGMDCRKTQSLIVPFIESQLTLEKARAFLKHIEDCEDCREELEVYYILLVGLKQLEEEPEESLDLHGQFEEHLRNTRLQVERKSWGNFPKIIILLSLIGFMLVAFTLEQQRYVRQKELKHKTEFINNRTPDYNPLAKVKKYNFYQSLEESNKLPAFDITTNMHERK